MAKDAAEDAHDYGAPLPGPVCGCCRGPVDIHHSNGTPYILRGEKHTPIIIRVIWKCRCKEMLDKVVCFLCSKCPDHCRCTTPAFMEPS